MNGHNVNTRSTFLVLSVIDHNSRHELHMGVRIGGKVLPHDLLCMRLSSNFILERNNLITSNQQIGFLEKFGEILWNRCSHKLLCKAKYKNTTLRIFILFASERAKTRSLGSDLEILLSSIPAAQDSNWTPTWSMTWEKRLRISQKIKSEYLVSKLRFATQKKGVMMVIITKGTCDRSIHDNLNCCCYNKNNQTIECFFNYIYREYSKDMRKEQDISSKSHHTLQITTQHLPIRISQSKFNKTIQFIITQQEMKRNK